MPSTSTRRSPIPIGTVHSATVWRWSGRAVTRGGFAAHPVGAVVVPAVGRLARHALPLRWTLADTVGYQCRCVAGLVEVHRGGVLVLEHAIGPDAQVGATVVVEHHDLVVAGVDHLELGACFDRADRHACDLGGVGDDGPVVGGGRVVARGAVGSRGWRAECDDGSGDRRCGADPADEPPRPSQWCRLLCRRWSHRRRRCPRRPLRCCCPTGMWRRPWCRPGRSVASAGRSPGGLLLCLSCPPGAVGEQARTQDDRCDDEEEERCAGVGCRSLLGGAG